MCCGRFSLPSCQMLTCRLMSNGGGSFRMTESKATWFQASAGFWSQELLWYLLPMCREQNECRLPLLSGLLLPVRIRTKCKQASQCAVVISAIVLWFSSCSAQKAQDRGSGFVLTRSFPVTHWHWNTLSPHTSPGLSSSAEAQVCGYGLPAIAW